MAVPQELYEAADVDGAGVVRRFLHITVPLLANLYLICTALARSGSSASSASSSSCRAAAPSRASEVLATLSIHYAFDSSNPALGVAAALSALPVLIPIVVILMRRIDARRCSCERGRWSRGAAAALPAAARPGRGGLRAVSASCC